MLKEAIEINKSLFTLR